MKKFLILLMTFGLFLFTNSAFSGQQCELIWNNVSGQTYILSVDNQDYDVIFSASGSGPCPQGNVNVFDGIYVKPVASCTYMTYNDNIIRITCNGINMWFMLVSDKLLLIDPNATFMTKK